MKNHQLLFFFVYKKFSTIMGSNISLSSRHFWVDDFTFPFRWDMFPRSLEGYLSKEMRSASSRWWTFVGLWVRNTTPQVFWYIFDENPRVAAIPPTSKPGLCSWSWMLHQCIDIRSSCAGGSLKSFEHQNELKRNRVFRAASLSCIRRFFWSVKQGGYVKPLGVYGVSSPNLRCSDERLMI